MKKIILYYWLTTCFLLFSTNSLLGQTYLGASIGYDYFSTPNISYEHDFSLLESANSLCFGLEIKQALTDDFFLSLKGTYSKKDALSRRAGFVPINRSKFKIYQISTEFGWYPFRNLYFSAGFNFTHLPNITVLFDEKIRGKYIIQSVDIGGAFSLGYEYNGFFIEMYYRKAMKSITYYQYDQKWKSQAVGILIGYRLKLFDKIKFNRKKANCPKL